LEPRAQKAMMLRNRQTNIMPAGGAAAAAKPGQDLPVKRAATKQLEDKTIDNQGGSEISEPKAKRAVLSELRTQLSSNLVIDSVRKGLAVKKVENGEIVRKTRTNSSSEHGVDKFSLVDKLEILEDVVEEEVVTTPSVDEDPCPEYDYDLEMKGHIFDVPEFAFDIFLYYRAREESFKVTGYMEKHPKLSKDSRAVLVDWMIEIQETFELNHETLYLAVKLVDIFLQNSKKAVNRSELQLIACAAVFVASKYDERQPPLVDDFLYVCEDAFSRQDLEEMECQLLRTVAYDLGAPLSYSHVRRFAKACKVDMNTLTLARYILETSLMYYEFVSASESKIAAGAFLLALKMTDSEAVWTPVMHKYSGYKAEEIEPWMWELNHMMYIRTSGVGVNAKLNTAFQKYSHEVFFHSATVPLIPDIYSKDRPLSCPN
ncbi:cyb-3, partial [Pristionchus pacificus]